MNWAAQPESGAPDEASVLATAAAYAGAVVPADAAAEAAEAPTVADLLPAPAGDEATAHQDGSALVQMLGALVPAPVRPLPPGGPAALAERVGREFTPVLPELGLGPASLDALAAFLPEQTVRSAHPRTVAHLHCPPDPVAMAADTLVGVLNPSQDSWDQSAAPSAIEDEVLAAFSALAFGAAGSGAITSGGTESNHLALLLARDEAVRRGFGVEPAADGLPPAACGRLRILASAVGHFSLARAAAQLGLGERAVIPVPVLPDHRLDPRALARIAAEVTARGERIAAVVATAGTTDAGAIDPLVACAKTARAHGAWFHVDAAYGGGLLLSDVRRRLLDGLELADSASVDLHKLGWQTIPAGLLLTRDPAALAPLSRRAAYLSDADDEAEGYPNLLGRSLHTTRRADAVKILAACRHHGRAGYTRMIESCFGQAAYVAAHFEADPRFELALPPALTTVLFRYRARRGDPDRVNAAVRRDLLAAGKAVIGRTRLPEPAAGPGSLRLKLTLLRPQTTSAELDALLDLIGQTAADRDHPGT